MNVLVTGGCGFIGSNFIRQRLTEKGSALTKLVNLDALTYAGNLENLSSLDHDPRHTFVRGGIGDSKLVTELLQKYKPRAVINFAAESHVDRSITGPEIFVETNVQGTLNLLQASKELGVERYLQVSTDEVYGSLGKSGYFYETTPLAPNSPPGASAGPR